MRSAILSLLPLASFVSAYICSNSPNAGSYACNADYIIVGGGTAGFVLAEELSLNSSVSVILIEAGPTNIGNPNIDTPGYAVMDNPAASSWNYTSQPDPNLNGATPALGTGRGFGGGSAINYLLGCRGAPSVYNEWANISGDSGLQWSNFFNSFKATVRYQQTSATTGADINATAYGNGPLLLTNPIDTLGDDFQYVAAAKAVLNLTQVDLSDGTGIGVTIPAYPIRPNNRTRAYSSQAWGWQLGGRSNVQVFANAQATHIGFDGTTAVNVTYINPLNNRTTTITSKEVILSAGALNSAKLLMLSGYGPSAQLSKYNIPVVKTNENVGQNLLDHHCAYMEFQVNSSVQTYYQYVYNTTSAPGYQAQYKQNYTGPLGETIGGPFSIFRAPDSVWAAANDTYHPNLPADRGQFLLQMATATLRNPGPNVNVVSPFVSLVQPQAAGYMQLGSADPLAPPLIYSNYYGSQGDKAGILWAYKQLRKVFQNSNYAPLIVKEIYPGSSVTSDAALTAAIQNGSVSFNHPMGTNALGTVVQGVTFRVMGLSGIRVIDSSIFPTMPTCQPMMATYAMAYYAAQRLKQQDNFSSWRKAK